MPGVVVPPKGIVPSQLAMDTSVKPEMAAQQNQPQMPDPQFSAQKWSQQIQQQQQMMQHQQAMMHQQAMAAQSARMAQQQHMSQMHAAAAQHSYPTKPPIMNHMHQIPRYPGVPGSGMDFKVPPQQMMNAASNHPSSWWHGMHPSQAHMMPNPNDPNALAAQQLAHHSAMPYGMFSPPAAFPGSYYPPPPAHMYPPSQPMQSPGYPYPVPPGHSYYPSLGNVPGMDANRMSLPGTQEAMNKSNTTANTEAVVGEKRKLELQTNDKRDIARIRAELQQKPSAPVRYAIDRRGRKQKLCIHPNCMKLSKGWTGRCIAHGGGFRCKAPGCNKHSQGGSLCISHGGGKRCTTPGCTKAAQSGFSVCAGHGGHRRCRIPNCGKVAQRKGKLCSQHWLESEEQARKEQETKQQQPPVSEKAEVVAGATTAAPTHPAQEKVNTQDSVSSDITTISTNIVANTEVKRTEQDTAKTVPENPTPNTASPQIKSEHIEEETELKASSPELPTEISDAKATIKQEENADDDNARPAKKTKVDSVTDETREEQAKTSHDTTERVQEPTDNTVPAVQTQEGSDTTNDITKEVEKATANCNDAGEAKEEPKTTKEITVNHEEATATAAVETKEESNTSVGITESAKEEEAKSNDTNVVVQTRESIIHTKVTGSNGENAVQTATVGDGKQEKSLYIEREVKSA